MGHNQDCLRVAIKAAHASGKIILDKLGGLEATDINNKQAADYVTSVDLASERQIIDTISTTFPGHGFMAEESGASTGGDGHVWIIDPLDGTTNFIHQYPMFAVSIACQYKGSIIAAVVYDPLRDETFSATKGGGAWLNDKQINVSSASELQRCLITTGFPFKNKQHLQNYLTLFSSVFMKVSGIRRAGAAALDLAHLAAGRCDGFFELGLAAWDIAAGSLLVTEAGGIITDFAGGTDYLKTGNIIGGVPGVHAELLDDAQAVFKGIIDE